MPSSRSAVACLAALAAVFLAALSPALPDTPAGKRAEAFAAALAAGGDATISRFIADNYARSALKERSAEDRAKRVRPMLAELGHAQLIGARPASELKIDLVFKAEKQKLWALFTFELEAAPPHGIVKTTAKLDDQPPG